MTELDEINNELIAIHNSLSSTFMKFSTWANNNSNPFQASLEYSVNICEHLSNKADALKMIIIPLTGIFRDNIPIYGGLSAIPQEKERGLLRQKIASQQKELENLKQEKIMALPSNLVLYCIQCAAGKWEKYGWIEAENEEESLRIICRLFNLSFSICHKFDSGWYECMKKKTEYAIFVDLGGTQLTDLIQKFGLVDNISFHWDAQK